MGSGRGIRKIVTGQNKINCAGVKNEISRSCELA